MKSTTDGRMGRSWPECLRPGLIHLVPTAFLLAIAVPVLHHVHFPLIWNWAGLLASFSWLALQAIAVAAVLYTVQVPREVWGRLRSSCFQDVRRGLLLVVLVAILFWAAGLKFAPVAVIDCLAIFEFLRSGRNRDGIKATVLALLPAAAYLFIGLVLAFTYTNVIVRVRFFAEYDPVFNRFDARFFGTTVVALSERFAAVAPESLFKILNFIYYGMFAQIGAALVISGLCGGFKRSIQFVGTIVLAYYVALVLFLLFPSHGPYYFASDTFARLHSQISAFRTQRIFLHDALYLWQQKPVRSVPLGFYIAFPCMHIAQPLIVLWFLRCWRRVVAILAAYDVALVAAIVLLQWHYFADLLGGVAVAGVVILLAARRFADESEKPQQTQAAGVSA